MIKKNNQTPFRYKPVKQHLANKPSSAAFSSLATLDISCV